MSILKIFSKRQKLIRGEIPDIFEYNNIPSELRVQVVHILRDALGESGFRNRETNQVFKVVHDALCREYGIFYLSQEAKDEDFQTAVFNFLLKTDEVEKVLDVIELSFRFVENIAGEYNFKRYVKPNIEPKDAISELNERFLEHGIGYQFESGEIIRVDSKFVHAEVIKPALGLLQGKIYIGANEEFLKAHDHYRNKRYKECINECLKSFESTMKAICEKRGWKYGNNDTAKKLLDICFEKGLIPEFLLAQFSSLRASLESGVPTARNKLSGHGQGTAPNKVPQYMARYLLNLTATSIILLTDAEENLS